MSSTPSCKDSTPRTHKPNKEVCQVCQEACQEVSQEVPQLEMPEVTKDLKLMMSIDILIL